jgi:phage-related protein
VANPTLELETLLTTPHTVTFPTKSTSLGDGYEQVGAVGKKESLTNYSITTKHLHLVDSDSLVNQLLVWRGIQAFTWTPDDLRLPKLYVCKRWELVLVSEFTRQLSATFEEVIA